MTLKGMRRDLIGMASTFKVSSGLENCNLKELFLPITLSLCVIEITSVGLVSLKKQVNGLTTPLHLCAFRKAVLPSNLRRILHKDVAKLIENA